MSIFGRAATLAVMLACAAATLCGSSPVLATETGQIASQPALQPAVVITTTDATDPDAAVTAPAVEFASLTEAVDAQPIPDTLDADLNCLAGAVYFESHGEPLAGQLAVAEVILNRANSGRFPRTLCSVVTQRGQFSFVHDGQVPAVSIESPAYRTAVAVARVALARLWQSPAPKALFFHARRVTARSGMVQIAAIGNHVFYR